MRNNTKTVAILLLGASLIAHTAHAQNAASESPAPQMQPQVQPQRGTTTIALAQDTAPSDAIIVSGRRFSEVARLQQKNAINLVNIQPAEELLKYPDFNAAEALGRIPGVSLSTDTGEGRFINIRGLDANLNGTTFGGVQLLNTQPGGTYAGGGGRAVEFDTIPIGSVDQLIVRKTGLPSQEAEGLGGSVDVIPRTAQGIKKPFLEGEIGGGYEPAHGHAGVYRAQLAAGYRFGPDKAFGIELNGSYHEDGRGFDDVEPAFADPNGVPGGRNDLLLGGVDLRRYNYNRRRFGFGGELTFDPTPQSHYYIRSDDAGYTERVNRQLLNYSNLNVDAAGKNLVADANGNFSPPNVSAQLSLRDQQETHLNFVTALGGHNDLGSVIVDYQGSFTAATYHRDYDYNSTFSPIGAGQSFPLTYNNSTITGLPAITNIGGGFNPDDASQLVLTGFRNTTEGAHDQEWAGRVDVTVPLHLIGEDENIKFGGKLRLRDKRDASNGYQYQNLPATPLTQVQGPGPYTNFYGGQYDIGFAPNYLALRALIAHREDLYLKSVTNRIFFNDTENIYAGYLEYQGRVDKLGYLVGVRVENTDGTYRTDLGGATDANGRPLISTGKSNYTDFFPTVQLRYDFTEKFIARATYSTAIGRPGFNQLQNGLNPDYGGPTLSVGNPSLRPTTDNAFDVSFEYYLPHSGILSVGFFDKEFDNYIVSTLATLSGTQVNAQYSTAALPLTFKHSDIVRVSGNGNVHSASARGIEANYNQKFTFLPGWLGGFGVLGNVTYVDSTIELHPDVNPGVKSQLPGTSALTWNLAGYYEAHGVQARLSANWVGPSIFGVGPAQGLDVYQDTKFQVDLTTSLKLSRQVTAYFNARNLFNGPLRYYEGYSNRAIQREFYDQTYEAGFRFAF
jgi:TonB-dependent receptor